MAFDATVAESVTPDNRSELMASRQLRNSLLLFSVNLALNSLGQIRSGYNQNWKKFYLGYMSLYLMKGCSGVWWGWWWCCDLLFNFRTCLCRTKPGWSTRRRTWLSETKCLVSLNYIKQLGLKDYLRLKRGFSMETLCPHEYDIPLFRGGHLEGPHVFGFLIHVFPFEIWT